MVVAYWFLLCAIVGVVFGSFLAAWTYRLPRKIKINEGRSFCPKCKKQITWFDNIPLLSYLFLGGKCRRCSKKISIRYPLIEASTSIIFLIIYYSFTNCLTSFGSTPFQGNIVCGYVQVFGWWALPYLLVMIAILIVIFVIDLEHKIIPDELSFSLYAIGLIGLAGNNSTDIYQRLFLSTLPALFLLSLNLITRGRGMGLGDVKLVLFGPLVLGSAQLTVSWMMLSFITGAIVGVFFLLIGRAKLGNQIPFGPFIIFSFFATLLFSDIIYEIFWSYLNI